MALNPNYVPLTPLWEVFTDKDLLTFLHDGYVKFYIDTERTVGKPVYQLTGSPPNYTYTQYGFLDTDGSWRVNMNLQGAFDQVIYGYPLDEFGNVQLYFADFYNVDGVFQFSREGFPNFFAAGGSTSTPVDINFIPDGQFRLHTDIPATPTLELGEVREPITQIAFGGWTFDRPVASTARDFVTFQRIGSFVNDPVKSPRYAVEVVCEAPNAGDTFKDLRVKFDDVNKFSSDTDMFTFGITGKTVASGDVNVELIIIKNFGTGGDATTETNLTTFTITNTFTVFSFSFVFGANTGKIIGQLNDDYVQLALRFPSNELFDVEFTDALLTPGNVISPVFNDTTTRQFLYESLFDDVNSPTTDGSDIGLPLVLTKTGIRFDDSQVGFIFPSSSFIVPFSYLEADGASYDTALYSSDGIPYSRLARKLLLSLSTPIVPLDFSIYLFGSGPNFLTADILLNLDIKISTNAKGATATPSDGANPTGFTFRNNHIGQVNILATGKVQTGNNFSIISDNAGTIAAPINATAIPSSVVLVNGTNARAVTSFNIGALGPSSYFVFYAPTGNAYLVWYTVNGGGTMPAVPGTTPIQIDVFTGISTADEAKITADSISGYQVSQITTVAASAIPQSAYFNVSTLSQNYYVWYNKDDGGVDPAIIGKIGIEVKISSSDTKDQVTSKTITSLNVRYMATPDLRGIFLKGYSGLSGQDLGASFRYASNSVTFGNVIGSREYSNNISHSHLLYSAGGGTENAWGFDSAVSPLFSIGTSLPLEEYQSPYGKIQSMTDQGSSESRPENIYVNYVIKY